MAISKDRNWSYEADIATAQRELYNENKAPVKVTITPGVVRIEDAAPERLSAQLERVGLSISMDLYQHLARETASWEDGNRLGGLPPIAYCALGLAGEAGELLEKLKKAYRDNDGVIQDRAAFRNEIFDVLWYASQIAHLSGWLLSEVAEAGFEKLASRANRGALGGSGDNR